MTATEAKSQARTKTTTGFSADEHAAMKDHA
ncbi:hypothetical protein ABH931_005586 [Streptacidiphilus sp. MAP12-33]